MIDSSASQSLGSEHGWRELEQKLRPFIMRRVRSEADVDDIVQEVFLRLQRGLPALRDEQRFGSWVYQVARSAIIDHLRAAARHPVASGQAPPELDAGLGELGLDEAERDQGTVEREVAAYAALFVAMLPSPYREALTLTELQGLPQKDAAEMLGISLSGMKSRVQRGRQKLRAALEACCHIALDGRRRVVACVPRADGKMPDGCCK